MDNIDEGMIKLTNHNDHPTNKAYKVFFFYKFILQNILIGLNVS